MKKKILIVEDDLNIQELLKREINEEERNWKIDTVIDGESGLIKARKNYYDLIYTGIMMPKMNGMDFIKSIKQEGIKYGRLAVFSPLSEESIIKEAFELGADGYFITSSFTPVQVVQIMSSLLEGKTSEEIYKYIEPIESTSVEKILEQKLEKNFLFRVVKVSYIIVLLFFGLIVLVFGWNEKPSQYIDSRKSYINCGNGNKYSLETVKIYLFSQETTLDRYDDEAARKACEYAISPTSYNYHQYQTPSFKNYTLNIVYSTRGSWGSAFSWWLLGISIVYVVLNIVKQALLYIIFGKRFSWDWLESN